MKPSENPTLHPSHRGRCADCGFEIVEIDLVYPGRFGPVNFGRGLIHTGLPEGDAWRVHNYCIARAQEVRDER